MVEGVNVVNVVNGVKGVNGIVAERYKRWNPERNEGESQRAHCATKGNLNSCADQTCWAVFAQQESSVSLIQTSAHLHMLSKTTDTPAGIGMSSDPEVRWQYLCSASS